jgi:hypothetical protein
MLTRKEGMSVEEFQRYWREVHGPLLAGARGRREDSQSHELRETY